MIDKLLHVSLLLLALPPCVAAAQGTGTRYFNPKGLVKPTGYTHLVIAPDGRTVYIAGQVAFDSAGAVVGIKHLPALREVRARYLARSQPPANTLVAVSSLARPELLIEIEGVALGSIVRH